MIRSIQQVRRLVTMYSKKMLHVKKCDQASIFQGLILTIRLVALFMRTSMEPFPAGQVDIMQSRSVN